MSENKDVKPGEQTSEYKVAQSSGVWGVVAMILGFVVSSGSAVLQSLDIESQLGIVIGAVITTAGAFLKCFTSLGYIKSRTDVKKIQ